MSIDISYTFTPLTVILSAEVNTNFTDLRDAIRAAHHSDADGTPIVNADVDASAAIAYSKLNLTGGIVNTDVNASAAIAWSKISKAGSVLSDIADTSLGGISAGDLLYRNGSNQWARLPIASEGLALKVNGGLPSWQSGGSIAFGGDGSDGALDTSGGVVNIDCSSAALVVKNYSSINIVTNNLTFSNPNSQGTTVVLRCSGDAVISATIDARGLGSAGGTAGSGGTSPSAGGVGTDSDEILDTTAHYGPGGAQAVGIDSGGAGSTGAAAYTKTGVGLFYTVAAADLYRKTLYVVPGAGGGGGGGGRTGGSSNPGAGGNGGAGGRGGGALMLEVSGDLNFTGTIDLRGQDGANGTTGANGVSGNGGGGGGGGAGGGGAGGMGVVLYNSATSTAGTINVTGGAGGTGGSGGNPIGSPGFQGGGGGGSGAGAGSHGGTGGNGGAGTNGNGASNSATGGAGGAGGGEGANGTTGSSPTGGTSAGKGGAAGGGGGGGGGNKVIEKNLFFA